METMRRILIPASIGTGKKGIMELLEEGDT